MGFSLIAAIWAAIVAKMELAELMTTLATLPNPDMLAGGKDNMSGFGDRGVNSSIGAQWRHSERLASLDAAADEGRKAGLGNEKMAAKLERCK